MSNRMNWKLDQTAPIRSVLLASLSGLIIGVTILVAVMMAAVVPWLLEESQAGFWLAIAYAAFLGVGAVFTLPFMLPLIFAIAPYSVVPPLLGTITSLFLVKRRLVTKGALVSLWVVIWIATFATGLLSGEILV